MEKSIGRKRVANDENGDGDSNNSGGISRRRCKTGNLGNSKCCYQCRRTDNVRIVTCSKCGHTNLFPMHLYPKITEEDFVKACPFCRGNCNCKSCLCLELPLKDKTRVEVKVSNEDKLHRANYLLKQLLPFVRQFNAGAKYGNRDGSLDSRVSQSEVKVQATNCAPDERSYCNYCRTSIGTTKDTCSLR